MTKALIGAGLVAALFVVGFVVLLDRERRIATYLIPIQTTAAEHQQSLNRLLDAQLTHATQIANLEQRVTTLEARKPERIVIPESPRVTPVFPRYQ